MKKIIFFVFVLLIASCKSGVIDNPIPEIVPDPEIVLTVSSDTVFPGESVIVTCVAKNAIKTTNNIGAKTTTNWTYPLTVVTDLKVIVTAVNKVGKIVSTDKIITVKEPPVVISTRADTICSKPWKITKARAQKTDGSGIWEDSTLNSVLSASSLFFYLNGRYEYFYENGENFGNGDWSLSSDGTTLTIGGKQFKIVEFTVSKMVLFYSLPCYGPIPDANGKYPLIRYVDAEDTYTR